MIVTDPDCLNILIKQILLTFDSNCDKVSYHHVSCVWCCEKNVLSLKTMVVLNIKFYSIWERKSANTEGERLTFKGVAHK